MTKSLSSEQERILAVVGRYRDGVGVRDLLNTLNLALSKRRTLQRRLSRLVDERLLVTEGSGKGMLYKLPDTGAIVTVSHGGMEIKRLMRQPRHARALVEYDPSFLERYVPNQTSYLPELIRDKLRRSGTMPEPKRLPGSFTRDILSAVLVDFSWTSSCLEGNTYSRMETGRLIEIGVPAELKSPAEAQMILNHASAIELLVEKAAQIKISQAIVLNLHAIIADGLLVNPRACGRIRERNIEVNGSVYQPKRYSPEFEKSFFKVLEMATAIVDPFEQAFFAMVHLPYLQPFEAMNESLSRVVANIPLIKNNLYPLSFLEISKSDYGDAMLGVFELNRVELLRDVFVHAYKCSSERYSGMKRVLVEGEDIQFRYRQTLSATIRAIIVGGQPVTENAIAAVLSPVVLEEDRSHFIKIVLDELDSLYEGNAMRFGLRPLQVTKWKKFMHT